MAHSYPPPEKLPTIKTAFITEHVRYLQEMKTSSQVFGKIARRYDTVKQPLAPFNFASHNLLQHQKGS